jgi:hypothetical protein
LQSRGSNGFLVPFKKDHSLALEQAYESNIKSLRLQIGKSLSSYDIDLSRPNDFFQRNVVSGHERSIHRVGKGSWAWQADESPNVGLYIEMKRPFYYRSIGLNLEERVVEDVEKSGFDGPVIIQCFEEETLRRFQTLQPQWDRVQLLVEKWTPLDSDPVAQKTMLDRIASYAQGIGPSKGSIIADPLKPPANSTLIDFAHERNLFVHPYTFKSDPLSLHRAYGGNASVEFLRFFHLGVDGVFADFPDHGVFARRIYESMARGTGRDVLDSMMRGARI